MGKRRYSDASADKMTESEMLFELLSFSMKEDKANKIANELLLSYGSLYDIFSDDAHSLSEKEGVNAHSAILLSLVYPLLSYAYSSDATSGIAFENTDEAGKFFVYKFLGAKDEKMYMLALDSKKKIIDCMSLGSGTVNEVYVSARKIADAARKLKCRYVIIAHNHPGGCAKPSSADISATSLIYGMLSDMDVELLDHIVVAGNEFSKVSDYRDADAPYDLQNTTVMRSSDRIHKVELFPWDIKKCDSKF